jgi:hypothetical protein
VDLRWVSPQTDSDQKFSLASFVAVLSPTEDPSTLLKVAITAEQLDRFLESIAHSLRSVLVELGDSGAAFDRVAKSNAEGCNGT